MSGRVAVLFARRDSIYKTFPECDVWDEDRDARNWPGGCPVIAHPPCRAWGQLAHFAQPLPGERELAPWAMEQVRRFGGVLEHPINSRLWAESACLTWGVRDFFGGILIPVYQSAFGHRASKLTGLYMVGVGAPEIPPPRQAVTTVQRMCRAERERTPPELARWLVDLVAGVRA